MRSTIERKNNELTSNVQNSQLIAKKSKENKNQKKS